MSRNEAEEVVSVVSLISISLGYINGIQLPKSGLLIHRTTSKYLNVRLKTWLLYTLLLVLLSQVLWGNITEIVSKVWINN
jgi:hypothetical protein